MPTFLTGFLYSPWMLLGLAVLAIPPIIHLLNRRRFDIVDWGAMQFLKISEVTRRRIMIEELLLMLLRMGLLGVLVFSLAGPFLDTDLPARLGSRSNRDLVLVIDGSASMAATDDLGGKSPFEKAREWAISMLDDLAPGDSVAVLQAKEQVISVVGELSVDLARVREKLQKMPAPAGSSNWTEAIKQAHAVLSTSQRGQREIILLGDNQRFGWADSDTLFRWELLASELGLKQTTEETAPVRPRIWMVNLAADRSSQPPNWALTPLRSNRPVVPVDREVTFRSDLVLFGQKSYTPPHRIRLEVDGKAVRDIPPPGTSSGRAGHVQTSGAVPATGKIPFSFTHRFGTPGSHLVTVILEADPPPEDRPKGYVVKDRVPGDNRQDFAVEVVTALPVLLIDGTASAASSGNLASDFMRDALSPARDRTPVVQTRVVPLDDFAPALLSSDPAPRVLILHNVPRLNAQQAEGITTFLSEGGGVLVTLGDRVEADTWNEQLYRGGEGWLPAQLDSIEGDEARVRDAVRPDPASFIHPSLELFRRIAVGGLNEARFPRWWKLAMPGKHPPGVPVGLLQGATARYPFFVARAFQAGRMMISSVPLDNSWGSNLTDLQAFVPLVHELVYYLAGARSADYNLKPGQPIRYRLEGEPSVEEFRLQSPAGEDRALASKPGEPNTWVAQVIRQERGALLTYDGARETGVYRLLPPAKPAVYYVVAPDARESDLTASNDEERERVSKLIGVQYEDDRGKMVGVWGSGVQRQDFWLYLLLGLIALLCLEVFMTRRLVKSR